VYYIIKNYFTGKLSGHLSTLFSNYLLLIFQKQNENTLNVMTAIGESYRCFLPKQDEVNTESETTYNGPSPLELLSPLFSKQACSYRVRYIL